MERTRSNSLQLILNQDKIRDGRYGPVCFALRENTGELVTAELLDVPGDPRALLSLLSALDDYKKWVQGSQGHPYIVSYLGHHRTEGKFYMLTEYLPGGTLRAFIRSYGALPQPLARSLLRQIALGLRHLQKKGRSFTLVNSHNILMSHDGTAKIESTLLDVAITGYAFPPAFVSLPEVVLGQRNMHKADVWLLGVIAAEIFSGNGELATSLSGSIASQIKQDGGSMWHFWVPQNVAEKLKVDERASEFLRQCFTV